MTIVVTGIGRCGTTLVMHMLHFGGVPTVGKWPGFEPEESNPKNSTPEWMAGLKGAVKIIDPLVHRPDVLHVPGLRFIFLTRNVKEQAKSGIKFIGLDNTRSNRRAIANNLKKLTPQTARLIADLHRPVLHLTFEELIADPANAARCIAEFVFPEFRFDYVRARRAVLDRGSYGARCLPYLLEERLGEMPPFFLMEGAQQ